MFFLNAARSTTTEMQCTDTVQQLLSNYKVRSIWMKIYWDHNCQIRHSMNINLGP